MLAGFLFGECVQPVFWQPDLVAASRCGLRNGCLYAALATVIGLAVYAGHRWKTSFAIAGASTFPMTWVLAGFIATVWIALPVLFRVSAVQQWHGYQAAITELMTDYGMTRLAAISIISSWHTGELDTGGASVISGAALLSTSKTGSANAAQCESGR